MAICLQSPIYDYSYICLNVGSLTMAMRHRLSGLWAQWPRMGDQHRTYTYVCGPVV